MQNNYIQKICIEIDRYRYKNSLVSLIARIKDKIFINFIGHKLILIEINKNSAIIRNHKVASTSISKAFDNNEIILENKRNIRKYTYKNIYVFVRNPYTRLFSAYNFLVKSGSISQFHFFKKNINFEDFILGISEIPNENCDVHFIPQSLLLTDLNGKLIPNKIFKFENIEEDFKRLCHDEGLKNMILEEINVSKEEFDFRKIYTKKMLKLVNKKYLDDFRIFNYKINMYE